MRAGIEIQRARDSELGLEERAEASRQAEWVCVRVGSGNVVQGAAYACGREYGTFLQQQEMHRAKSWEEDWSMMVCGTPGPLLNMPV